MTFIADEQSTQGSRPVELYTITLDGSVLRLARHQKDYVYSANTYTRGKGLTRRNIVREPAGGNVREVEVTMALSHLAGYVPGPPPEEFTISIVRVQPTGAQTIFTGDVTNTVIEGAKVTLRCEADGDSAMEQMVPALRSSPQCGHILYGPFCRAVRTDHDHATTVSSATGLTVTVASVAANTDYTGGEIYMGAQKRQITKHVGTLLTINYAFRTAPSGSVTLYRACDRTLSTCKTVFNNVVNFGGFAFVPVQNIFRVGFRGIRR